MEHTEYHQLSLWDEEDRILRTDFNSDNAKTEAALADYGEMLGWLNGIGIEAGSYVGTGQAGPSHPNTLTFSGKPLLVFVGGATAGVTAMLNPAAGALNPAYSSGILQLTWGTNSVSWSRNTADVNIQMNAANTTYHYLALLEME